MSITETSIPSPVAKENPVQPADIPYLGLLSAGQRDALVLIAIRRLKYEDAAKELGCQTGTIKSRVHRGRGNLSRILAAPDRLPAELSRIKEWGCEPITLENVKSQEVKAGLRTLWLVASGEWAETETITHMLGKLTNRR